MLSHGCQGAAGACRGGSGQGGCGGGPGRRPRRWCGRGEAAGQGCDEPPGAVRAGAGTAKNRGTLRSPARGGTPCACTLTVCYRPWCCSSQTMNCEPGCLCCRTVLVAGVCSQTDMCILRSLAGMRRQSHQDWGEKFNLCCVQVAWRGWQCIAAEDVLPSRAGHPSALAMFLHVHATTTCNIACAW